jgi:hypothetical protein
MIKIGFAPILDDNLQPLLDDNLQPSTYKSMLPNKNRATTTPIMDSENHPNKPY